MTELESLLGKQWTKRDGSVDTNMVEHCLKAMLYIDVGEYYLQICQRKPGISRVLYYDDELPRPDTSSFEVFRAYNMRGARSEFIVPDNKKVYIYDNYHGDRTGGKIKSWCVSEDEPRHVGSFRLATDDDLAAIKQGLNQVHEDYEKRLKTYWKRYANKVYAHGYWADR